MAGRGGSATLKAALVIVVAFLTLVGAAASDVLKAITANTPLLVTLVVALVVAEEWIRSRLDTRAPPLEGSSFAASAALERTATKMRALRRNEEAGSSVTLDVTRRLPELAFTVDGSDDVTDSGIPAQDLPRGGSTVLAGAVTRELIREGGRVRYLVLGEPGSGKTTFLRAVTDDFIAHMTAERHRGRPFGVVLWFDLVTWSNDFDFDGWLRERLAREYKLSSTALDAWISDNNLLLVLDNISWLNPELRGRCARQVGAFLAVNPGVGVLIAANPEMVRPVLNHLRFHRLTVQDLTPAQVLDVLARCATTHRHLLSLTTSADAQEAVDQADPQATSDAGPDVLATLANRLYLTSALAALDDASLDREPERRDRFTAVSTTAALQHEIVDALVDYHLTRTDRLPPRELQTDRGSPDGRRVVVQSLAWLARRLDEKGLTLFHDYVYAGDVPRGRDRDRVIAPVATAYALQTWFAGFVTLAAVWTAPLPAAVAMFAAAAWAFAIRATVYQSTVTDEAVRQPIPGGWSWRRARRELRRPTLWNALMVLLLLNGAGLAARSWRLHHGAVTWQFVALTLTSAAAAGFVVLVAGWQGGEDPEVGWAALDISPSQPRRFVLRNLVGAAVVLVFGLLLVTVVAAGVWAAQVGFGWRVARPPSLALPPGWGVGELVRWAHSTHWSARVFVSVLLFGLLWMPYGSILLLWEARRSHRALSRAGLATASPRVLLDYAVQLTLVQPYAGGEFAFRHQLIQASFSRRFSLASEAPPGTGSPASGQDRNGWWRRLTRARRWWRRARRRWWLGAWSG